MNQLKNTSTKSDWILCPSKSFPDKFYYFNVVNGETAWSLNEIENNARKEFNAHRLLDAGHSYPKVTGHPDDNTSDSTIPQVYKRPNFFCNDAIPSRRIFNNNQAQSSVFGQTVMPKYISNIETYMPNIVWLPIQLPVPTPMQASMQTPMYVRNTPEVNKNMSNRVSQSQERCLFVQACNTSLSKRFAKYQRRDNHMKSSQNNNYKITNNNNNIYNTSTPVNTRKETSIFTPSQMFCPSNVQKPKSVLKKPTLRRLCSLSESSVTANKKPALTEVKSLDVLQNFDRLQLKETEDTIGTNLDCDDLRLFLLARRRKSAESEDIGGYANNAPASKKIKTSKDEQALAKTPQKRVTFNLQEQINSESCDDQLECSVSPPQDQPAYSELNLRTDWWYVVVDPDTLIDEYQFIEEYVQSDPKCRLLLPRIIQSAVEASCVGDCQGRQRIINARQLARRLRNPPSYLVPLPDIEDTNNRVEEENCILKCCLHVINSGHTVMLLTNSTNLCTDAVALDISCIKVRDLKANFTNSTPEITFDFEKVNLNMPRTNPQSNLFLKCPNEFEPYMFRDKEDLRVNSSKEGLRNIEERASHKNLSEARLVDANTSYITSKTFLEAKRKNSDITDQGNKENTNSTTENVFIKDRQSKAQNETQLFRHVQITFNDKLNTQNEKQKSVTKKQIAVNEKQDGADNFEIQNENEPKSYSQMQTKEVFNENYTTKDVNDNSKKSDANTDLLEEKIKLRMDEWLCTFSQIIEDALTQVLNKRNGPIEEIFTPPWVLFDVIEAIVRLYEGNGKVKTAAYDLNSILMSCSCKIGKFKSWMSPNDFMRLFECGLHLIQTLKVAQPTYPELVDAERSLTSLFSEMENPRQDAETPLFHTPVLSRSEEEIDRDVRPNFLKKPSYIIDYLKKHFSDWRSYEPPLQQQLSEKQIEENVRGDMKIVRTTGRNLNLLNLACNKFMTVRKPIVENMKVEHGNTTDQNKNKIVNDVPKTTKERNTNKASREMENLFSSDANFYIDTVGYSNTELNEPKLTRKIRNSFSFKSDNQNSTSTLEILNTPKHGNTFGDGEEKDGPKVIRHVQPIKVFEEKLKEQPEIIDVMDYSKFNETVSMDSESTKLVIVEDNNDKFQINENNTTTFNESASFVSEIKNVKNRKNDDRCNNKNDYPKSNKSNTTSVDYDEVASAVKCDSESVNVKDDNTNDSGFENDSLHAHCLVKTFLMELSSTFKAIHQFIESSISDFSEDEMKGDKKHQIHSKANSTHLILVQIIDKLKRIIERESNDSTTLKAMLIKAGVQASTDKRMTRYRQIVTKCLEQAQTLKSALKIMLSETDDDYAASLSSATRKSNRYVNIFE